MLKLKKNSIVLMHGTFQDDVLRSFKNTASYFVLEGRPDLLSSKSTIKLFSKQKIVPTVVADNMPGFLFYKGLVKEVRLAYQYTDSSGALCEVGSLILGVLARTHQVPVFLYPGKLRRRFLANHDDILTFNGRKVGDQSARVYGPLVEWLAQKYITKIYGSAKT